MSAASHLAALAEQGVQPLRHGPMRVYGHPRRIGGVQLEGINAGGRASTGTEAVKGLGLWERRAGRRRRVPGRKVPIQKQNGFPG